MKIRHLSVDGFRGLPDREFSFLDPRSGSASDLVLITGGRASGKTSLLEAIIANKEQIGPYGPMQQAASFVRIGVGTAKVRAAWELSAHEREQYGIVEHALVGESIFGDIVIQPPDPDGSLSALLSTYVPDAQFGKVEYFHATRCLPLGAVVDLSKVAGSDMDRMARLTRDDLKYSGLIRYLVEAGLGLDVDAEGRAKPKGRIKRAFDLLCPTKQLGGLYRVSDSFLPAFLDSQNRAYSLAQLSDSERDALLFAITFVRAELSNSVVLIDTPEKHLGDVETRAFIKSLTLLGENNQLIVATQSPSLLSSVQSDQVIHLG